MKFILRLAIGVIAASFIGIYAYLQYLKPDYDAEVQLKGLTSEVEVLFDDHAIPHVYAQNEEDLWYALGYVHAQDRLFQMELLRRLGDGRLAEIFGEEMVPVDQFFRTLGFRQFAQKTIDSVYKKNPSAPFVKNAEAYIKGVNQFIKTGKTPIEFTLAGIPKTDFTLEDSEIISGYMSYSFMEAFRGEAITEYIHQQLGPDYLQDLGVNTAIDEPKIPVDKLFLALSKHITKLEKKIPAPPLLGSNGWVISGKKTKSGKPILSNDTHISFAQPSVWYEAHLSSPGFQFYGNFVAGVPFAYLGHNDHGGWGLTMFLNDEMDFYREKVNPKNENQVWFQDKWEDLKVREEEIQVKGKAAVPLVIRESRHGVLISDVMKTKELTSPFVNQTDPISLFWTYFKFPSRNLEACYGMAHSKNAQEVEKYVQMIHSPGLNVMWGDTEGNIAWWATAKLIKRPPHVQSKLVLDGSSGKDEPLGWHDFAENPQSMNPENGVLYSANNQPAARNGLLYPGYYVPVDRATRIQELLFTAKSDWTPDQVREVINDVTNPVFVRMLATLIPVFESDITTEEGKKGVAMLKNWKGQHTLESIEPALFYRFMYRIDELLLKDEMGDSFFDLLRWNMFLEHGRVGLYLNDASKWWDNVQTPAQETRKQILTEAFRRAVQDLEKEGGLDAEARKWKYNHTLTHPHPMGVLPVIGRYFNVGPLPAPGGKSTINNLDFRVDSTGKYDITYGPALRRIIDFGYPENATSINPTGQSGYFMSKYYKDQAEMYAQSKARKERMNRKEIQSVQMGRMRLKP
ncbi:MAG: penicillin acylase family protein [Spirosomataceae bacterium]